MSLLALLAALAVQTPALAARDAARLTPHLAPEARMIVAVEGADGSRTVRTIAGAAFAAGLQPGPERFEEIMPDPIIAIDGDIAMVWGRYVFTIDGATRHCGSNHFDLIRRDGVWTIAGITWNQRTTGCEGDA